MVKCLPSSACGRGITCTDTSSPTLVAFDVLGSGVGERVLVATGSVASGWFEGHPPIDALIIGSIDEPAGMSAAGGTDKKRGKADGG